MKKTVFFILSIIIAAVLSSCGPNDQKLQTEVRDALSVNYPQINSSVKDRVVTLTGTVESPQTKTGAEQAVKAVKHVKSVNNNIEVKAPAAPIRVNNDDVIRTHIVTKLVEDGYDDVKVKVRDGEVTLTGNLKRSELEKVMKIANDAKPTPTKVNNELTLN
ncbi:MAG: BON domain-containing protein [Odoribacter sp.]|nr:BON domain-containing protein [Odoribacter sp.]